jgi:hypothetical protein
MEMAMEMATGKGTETVTVIRAMATETAMATS